jgi:phosphatidylglycerophosphate synthase
MSAPSVAEVRSGGQPPGLKDRRNEEHWAGRLYMRRISPYFTWLFVRIGFSPNQLTYLMIVCGVLGGAAVAVSPNLVWAIVGAVLIQAYLLLDCSDGEVARFRKRTSVTGVYLDRIGHYMSEVALLAGLGVRAEGAWQNGGYVELGLLAALGAALIKAETDNVVVARAKSNLPAEPVAGDRALRPESTGLALAREAVSLLKLHRIIGAVELSLLIVAAAVVDHLTHAMTATRVLTVAVAAVAVVQTGLHFVSIVATRRHTRRSRWSS